MAQPPRRRASFRVRFDELAFAEDLRHATPKGRQAALDARRRLERDGADVGELRPCAAEARDGTRLPNCVKTYLPDAAGRWRMIFEVVRDPESRELLLACRAFGVGHPEHPWQRSAYHVADYRLHAGE